MKICDEFWDEFMKWAEPMNRIKDDAEIYDVFNWLRELQQGSVPYSEKFIAKLDLEIEKEEARNAKQ